MKKFTAIIILIIGILAVSISNFSEVKKAFELKIKDMNVETKLINKDNKFIEASLKIPVLTISNKEIQKAVNKKIESDIMKFYNDSFKEAENYFDDFPEMENKFVANSDFEIKKNTENILSILIKYYKYSGGAHGYYEYIPYNIDLASGKVFILKDIFKEGSNYEQAINDEIKKQIGALNLKNNLPEESTQLYTFKGINETQKFYLKDDKIVVFFNLYDIAPYAAGIPEFSIDKSIIQNLLNEKYKQVIIETYQSNNL